MQNMDEAKLIEKTEKLNKLNKILLRVFFVILALLAIAICVAIFYEPEIPELPKEFKQHVASIIAQESDKFSVRDITLAETGTIMITLEMNYQPKNEGFIEANVKNFLYKIGQAYNFDLDLNITVVRPIENTDKVWYFGRGTFYKDTGKIEYEPAK